MRVFHLVLVKHVEKLARPHLNGNNRGIIKDCASDALGDALAGQAGSEDTEGDGGAVRPGVGVEDVFAVVEKGDGHT